MNIKFDLNKCFNLKIKEPTLIVVNVKKGPSQARGYRRWNQPDAP